MLFKAVVSKYHPTEVTPESTEIMFIKNFDSMEDCQMQVERELMDRCTFMRLALEMGFALKWSGVADQRYIDCMTCSMSIVDNDGLGRSVIRVDIGGYPA